MSDQTLPPLPTVFGDDDAAQTTDQIATGASTDAASTPASPASDVPIATSLPSLDELNKMFSDKSVGEAPAPENTDISIISAPPVSDTTSPAPTPLEPAPMPEPTPAPLPTITPAPEPSPAAPALPSLADLNATLEKVAPEPELAPAPLPEPTPEPISVPLAPSDPTPPASDDLALPSFLAQSASPTPEPQSTPAPLPMPENTDTPAISASPTPAPIPPMMQTSSDHFSLSPLAMIDQQLSEIETQLAAINAKIMSLTTDSNKLKKEIERKQYAAQVLEYTLSASQNYLAQLNQQKTDLLTAKQHITS